MTKFTIFNIHRYVGPSIPAERVKMVLSGRSRRITPILFRADFYLDLVMFHYSHVLYAIFVTPTLSS